jgi:hypothetical protein
MRREAIQKDTLFWRSQLANDWCSQQLTNDVGEVDSVEVPAPANAKRMLPFPDRATEGRVNPKGIPCLYLSTDRDTAMAEVRPWPDSYVSAAQFMVCRDLTVVDCSAKSPNWVCFGEPAPEEREEIVWGHINRAFAEPVTRSDDVADYAPTQVLAEAFRSRGFDGVMYGSRLGVGKTIAIFDLAVADLINCHLYQTKSVTFTFARAAHPYFIPQYSSDSESRNAPGPG